MKKVMIQWLVLLGGVVLLPTIVVMVGGHYTPDLLQRLYYDLAHEEQEMARQAFDEQIVRILAYTTNTNMEEETLKAQAVIIRTYLMKRQQDESFNGRLGEMSIRQMKTLWQEEYDTYYEKYMNAVKSTQNQVIIYNNQLIEPVFHRGSVGRTRNAKAVYGVDIEYLQPVESAEEILSYEKKMLKSEIVSSLQKVYPELLADTDRLEQQIQVIAIDQIGYVETLQIANIILDGETFAELLKLPSSNFKMKFTEKEMIFEVKGYGNGIGLSQNGSDAMAQKGKLYEEILKYYYTNVKIIQMPFK